MKKKISYIRPSVIVLCLKDFMQADLGMYSTVGDAGELAKETDFCNQMDDEGTWGCQDDGYIWEED